MNDDSILEPLTRHFFQADAMPQQIFAAFIIKRTFAANEEEMSVSSSGATCKPRK